MPRIKQDETTQAIYAAKLARNIPKLAKKWGLDPGVLHQLAEMALFRCPICSRAIARPHLFRANGEPKGIICGYCETALRAIDYDPFEAARPRIGARPGPRASRAKRFKNALVKPLERPRRFRYRAPSTPKPTLLRGRWTKDKLRRLFALSWSP